MIEKYKTVSKSSWKKITIKNSRFFSKMFYLSKREKIKKILEQTEQNYKKPTHIVYAYRIIENNNIIEFSTDSGEPTNSSGPPILKVINGKELLNICLVVVRYFGGTKLGVGGLIKAYTGSAQIAIKNSKFITKENCSKIYFNTNYEKLGNIIEKIKRANGKVKNIEYGKMIKISAEVPVAKLQNFPNFRKEKT
ncbi:MAG: YigZ family protein [Candidatus Cloacimonetes bacterium]|nr:YigZ family protein [Candidatus Cloacimonadota bacterium]